MKEFNLTLPWMYFSGLKNGDIKILFFEKLPFKEDLKKGDLIIFNDFDLKLKMYFDYSKILSFKDVTNDMAKKAGFANRELLCDHLMNRFDITSYSFLSNSKIDKELFYMLVLTDDPVFSDGEVEVKMNVVPGSMISTTDYTAKCKKDCWLNNLTLNDEYVS